MWSNRNIRRVALARLVSSTGGEAAFFVGIWGRAAYDFDAQPAQLALMMAVLGVMSLLGSALAGVLIDRLGPRRVLIGAEVLFAPAALSLVLPSSMATLTSGVAVVGLVGSVVYTTVASFAPYLSDDENLLARTNAAVEMAGTAAFISGPAIGAILARYAGLDWIFVFDAATSIVGVALIAPVKLRSMAGAPGDHSGALGDLRDGFRFVYGVPRLRFLILLGTATWLSFGVFSAVEPIFFREVLRVGPEALGIVNAIFGIGLAAGAAVVARFSGRLLTITAAAVMTFAGGLGAAAYSGTPWVQVVTIAGVGWGFVLGMLMPTLRTLVQGATPDGLQGRAMGVLMSHHTLGEMLPLAVVPALAAVLGVQTVMISAGLGVAIVGLLALPAARRMDRSATPVTPADVDLAEVIPRNPLDQPVAAADP